MSNLAPLPPLDLLCRQADALALKTPALAPMLRRAVRDRTSFADALAHRLVDALKATVPVELDVLELFGGILADQPAIVEAAWSDLHKLASTNPACPNALAGFLSFRGFQAVQLHRINHALWFDGQEELAALLQNWGAITYAIDIHPQARIGRDVFLDHGVGTVIGATAVIEDGANIWHGVTLGSTLTQAGDRHPKVRRGVTIGAGATLLGNIEVGEGAVIAAGSVVLHPVDPFTVVAGVPARPVGTAKRQLDAIAAKSPEAGDGGTSCGGRPA
ncbi:serine O-acetyltransferase EpsC [Azospirillum griseum]|uniref:Serine acetyltransferase n=1 Tax=Azospirillum griseum TaxID=2496639 RepID=A0A3S0K7I1_9PROT|nr:serine O-acetyltransferase EpsC [Azospirillum griseum]RTR14598.1 serine acetyltransferase [Azospirillum griseum]